MERRIELEYAIGEEVAPAEIVKEPTVDLGITQCLLNLADTLIYGRAAKPSMRRPLRSVVMLQCALWQSSMHQSLPSSA